MHRRDVLGHCLARLGSCSSSCRGKHGDTCEEEERHHTPSEANSLVRKGYLERALVISHLSSGMISIHRQPEDSPSLLRGDKAVP